MISLELENEDREKSRQLAMVFRRLEGRPPRVMLTGKGRGVPEMGAAKLATQIADLGFNVDFGPLCSEASDILRQASENDVDIICLLQTKELEPLFLEQICGSINRHESEGCLLCLIRDAEIMDQSILGNTSCFTILDAKELHRGFGGLLQEMIQR